MLSFVFHASQGFGGFLLGYAVLLAGYGWALKRARAAGFHYGLMGLAGLVPVLLCAAVLSSMLPSLQTLFVVPQGLLHLAIRWTLLAVAGFAAGSLVARFLPGSEERGSLRGADLIERPTDRRHPWNRKTRKDGLIFASIPMAVQDETKHFKIVGTTGTGKTTAIRLLLEQAFARGDRAVIADPNGDFSRHCFDESRGDVILNPFDTQSVRWDPFLEIASPQDADVLAAALVPNTGASEEKEWRRYARDLVGGVLKHFWLFDVAKAPEARDVTEVLRQVTSASQEELAETLRGKREAALLNPENEKMFGSVRAVAGSAVAGLEYVAAPAQTGRPFSVRQWVSEGQGVLFIPYQSDEIAPLQSMISAWLSLAITEGLKRRQDAAPLWLVVDELDALGPIDGLKNALTRLRQCGGRCVLGFQAISQVSGNYGPQEADAIVENCGNTLILRCSGSEGGGTAEFASRLIGDRVVKKTSRSRSKDSNHWFRRTETQSEHEQVERAVMASEIEQIADLHGFLKIASEKVWIWVGVNGQPPRDAGQKAFPWWPVTIAAAIVWAGAAVGDAIRGAEFRGLRPAAVETTVAAAEQASTSRARSNSAAPGAHKAVTSTGRSRSHPAAAAVLDQRLARSIAPTRTLAAMEPDAQHEWTAAETVGTDEFPLMALGLKSPKLADEDAEAYASAVSYEYRMADAFGKKDLLATLRSKWDARTAVFHERYFVMEKAVYLGRYDVASQSFPLKPDAANVVPWMMEGTLAYWPHGRQFTLQVSNMNAFQDYAVPEASRARELEALSVSQRSGKARVYFFAEDVSGSGRVRARIVRMELLDYSGDVIGEMGSP